MVFMSLLKNRLKLRARWFAILFVGVVVVIVCINGIDNKSNNKFIALRSLIRFPRYWSSNGVNVAVPWCDEKRVYNLVFEPKQSNITISQNQQRYLTEDIGALPVHTKNSSSINIDDVMEHEMVANENESNIPPAKHEGLIVSIVLVFILLTIAFEFFRETLEQSVTHDEEVILERLFGELTVLGFLSTITFIVVKSGLIRDISEFFEFEEEEVIEFVEQVHYAIFSIMVFFVFQVIVLLREATQTDDLWNRLEECCRAKISSVHKNNLQNMNDSGLCYFNEGCLTNEEEQALERRKKATWYTKFIPQFTNANDQFILDLITYQGFRHEFLLDRSTVYPFDPKPKQDRLPDDFNFARLLTRAQVHVLKHVVEVEISAWLVFVVGALLFYCFVLLVHDDNQIMIILWISLGWMVFTFNIVFEQHLVELRNQFIPKCVTSMIQTAGTKHKHQRKSYSSPSPNPSMDTNDLRQPSQESSPLVNEMDPDILPAWCYNDPDLYMSTKRSVLATYFVGGVPNRQQLEFWMDRNGPSLYLFILQLNMIFLGVYIALLVLVFLPEMYSTASTWIFLIHLLLSVLPAIGLTYNKKRIVAVLTEVTSVGSYRNYQIISEVLREKKLAHLVRTLITTVALKVATTKRKDDNDSCGNVKQSSTTTRNNDSTRGQQDSFNMRETFDVLDKDGNGMLTLDEIHSFLLQVGMDVSINVVKSMLLTVDTDMDGEISKEEFLHWYLSLNHSFTSKDLFELFDRNQNGTITIGEFKEGLDRMNIRNFTIDEIGSVVTEMDRNHSGNVTLFEFTKFIAQYTEKSKF